MNKQRIYDAMLIKAFRKDIRMTDLDNWLAPYSIKLMDRELKRIPKKIWWAEKVRVMVGNNMKLLSDRLWDTDRSEDIKTLDWMKNVNCSNPNNDKIQVEKRQLKNMVSIAGKKGEILSANWDGHKRSNQWNVTK